MGAPEKYKSALDDSYHWANSTNYSLITHMIKPEDRRN
jgi:hypothetical protein